MAGIYIRSILCITINIIIMYNIVIQTNAAILPQNIKIEKYTRCFRKNTCKSGYYCDVVVNYCLQCRTLCQKVKDPALKECGQECPDLYEKLFADTVSTVSNTINAVTVSNTDKVSSGSSDNKQFSFIIGVTIAIITIIGIVIFLVVIFYFITKPTMNCSQKHEITKQEKQNFNTKTKDYDKNVDKTPDTTEMQVLIKDSESTNFENQSKRELKEIACQTELESLCIPLANEKSGSTLNIRTNSQEIITVDQTIVMKVEQDANSVKRNKPENIAINSIPKYAVTDVTERPKATVETKSNVLYKPEHQYANGYLNITNSLENYDKQRRKFIYEQLRKTPWVEGYYSEGNSIQVFVDLETNNPDWALERICEITGQLPNKFHIKHSDDIN